MTRDLRRVTGSRNGCSGQREVLGTIHKWRRHWTSASRAAGDSWSTEEADNDDSEDSDEAEDGTGAGEDCEEAGHSHRGRSEIREAGDTEARRKNVAVSADADSSQLLSGIGAEIPDPPPPGLDDKCCLMKVETEASGDFSNH